MLTTRHRETIAFAATALALAVSRSGWAQHSQTPSQSVAPTTVRAAARITLIGSSAEYDALARAVASLLSARDIGTLFESRQQFTERDFWEPLGTRGLNWVHVWLLMSTPRSARLVFADPELQRFLIRDLPVPMGLDDLGCEAVAQVIESSVTSLLQGGGGLNRSELKNALTNVWVNSPEAPVQPPVSGAQHRKVSPDPVAPQQRQIRPRLEATYRLAYTGGFGWLHGPGLMLGAELPTGSSSVIFAAQLEAYFTEHSDTQDVRVSVQNTTAWAELGWKTSTRIHNVYHLATIGIGLNRAHVEPEASQNPRTFLEPNFNRVRPWLRIANRFEWNWGSLPWQLGFFVDASPYKPRYELTLADGTKEQVAAGSFLRFGIATGVAFH